METWAAENSIHSYFTQKRGKFLQLEIVTDYFVSVYKHQFYQKSEKYTNLMDE